MEEKTDTIDKKNIGSLRDAIKQSFIQKDQDKIKEKVEKIKPEVVKQHLEKYCERVVDT